MKLLDITRRPPRLVSMTLAHVRAVTVFFLVALGTSTSAISHVRDGPASRDVIRSIIVEEAFKQGVPVDLALAVAKVESNFHSNALSNKGARGVMQIMPATAWELYGVSADKLWDPQINIALGVRHLADLRRSLGRWDLALAGYYAGAGVAKYGLEKVSPDVRSYVAAVLDGQRRQGAQIALNDGGERRHSIVVKHEKPAERTLRRVTDVAGRYRQDTATKSAGQQQIALAAPVLPAAFSSW